MTCDSDYLIIENGNIITSTYSGALCVSIPSNVVSVESTSQTSYAFQQCASTITNIDFSQAFNLEHIGPYSFFQCTKVSVFNLSSCTSLSSIGICAFRECTSAISFIFPNSSLTTIPGGCFADCTSLSEITIPSNVVILNSDNPTNYGVFYRCSNLASVFFRSDSLLTILRSKVFLYSGIVNLTLPKKVTSISGLTFRITSKLQNIFVESDNEHFKDVNGILLSNNNALIYFPQCHSTEDTANIPDCVTSIYSNAFCGVNSYKYCIIIPSVTSVGNRSFFNFASLISINIPSSLPTLSSNMFESCTKLENITFENNPSILPGSFLLTCTSLTSFIIPSSVQTLESDVFNGCSKLRYVFVPRNVSTFGSGVFSGCPSDLFVEFEEGSGVKYHNYFLYNQDFTDIIVYLGSESSITIISSVLNIGNGAFRQKTSITNIDWEFSSNISSIQAYAFYGCSNLKTFCFPPNVDTISEYCFYGCSKLESITFPSSLNSILQYSFYGCKSLTNVEFPNGLLNIQQYAFYDSTALSSVTFSDSLSFVGIFSFSQCSSLSSIHFPSSLIFFSESSFSYCGFSSIIFETGSSLLTLERLCFSNCINIIHVEFPDNIESIPENSFSQCSSLEIISIGKNISNIEDYAFSSCSSLHTVIIDFNFNLESISYLSFIDCNNLCLFNITSESNNFLFTTGILFDRHQTRLFFFLRASGVESVYIPSTVTSIQPFAFQNSHSITNVSFLGQGIHTLGHSSFEGCSSLRYVNFPSSLTEIQTRSFSSCDLRYLDLTLTQIISLNDHVFSYNTHLSAIYLPSCLLSVSSSSFLSVQSHCIIYYFGSNVISNSAGFKSSSKSVCLDIYPSSIFLGLRVYRDINLECYSQNHNFLTNTILSMPLHFFLLYFLNK